MNREAIFTPIDINAWPRAQSFHYFTQMAPTTYSVNVPMDVTNLRKRLKARGLKFFPAYLYLVCRAVARQSELRVAVQDGVLGHWDRLTPAYPQFHEDDKTTSLLWTEPEERFEVFYERYQKDTATHGNDHGILTGKGIPPANAFIASCIPWFSFHSFSLHNHGIKDYYFPSFEAGGFAERGGRTEMPLSVTVHHAATDGYHLKVLFEELQRTMNDPDEWM